MAIKGLLHVYVKRVKNTCWPVLLIKITHPFMFPSQRGDHVVACGFGFWSYCVELLWFDCIVIKYYILNTP